MLEDINSQCLSPTSSDGATLISASSDVIPPSRADRSFVAERGIIFPHLQVSRETESHDLSVNVDESVVVSQSHVFHRTLHVPATTISTTVAAENILPVMSSSRPTSAVFAGSTASSADLEQAQRARGISPTCDPQDNHCMLHLSIVVGLLHILAARLILFRLMSMHYCINLPIIYMILCVMSVRVQI